MISEDAVRALRQHILEDANRRMSGYAAAARGLQDLTQDERDQLSSDAAAIAALSAVLDEPFEIDWGFLNVIAGGS